MLIFQKYPKDIVTQGIKKESIIPLEVLRPEKVKENKQVLLLFSTFNPNNLNLSPLIRKTFDSLQHGTTTKVIFQKYKLIDSKCQSALGQLLCSSNLSLHTQSFTVSKYQNNWFCCHHIKDSSKLKFIRSAREFKLKASFHYETPNLVYVTICDGRKIECKGQTEGQLKDKLGIHR